ncbi:MAG TPA: CARDB domain-containing protein, partial [Candidatus Thermoplasmatota archaeon]|nr:CARDB domain-containing protein [Candidatus Thermoplasmatota archaeon]
GNVGTAPTGSGFDVRVKVAGEARTATATALAAGAEDRRTVSFGSLPAGTRTVTCEVNTDRAIAETNHDNSGWSTTRTWVAAPRSPPTCRPAAMAAATVTAGESVTFALSCTDPDGDGAGNEWYVDGRHQGNTDAEDGSAWTATKAIAFPNPGTYLVEANGHDRAGAYTTSSTSWRVSVSPAKAADLVIHDLRFSPDPPQAGREVEVTCRYGNAGSAGTGASFPVQVSLGGETRTATASPLAPGAADERTLTFGAQPAGARRVACVVNGDRAVAETNHDNSGWSTERTWVEAPARPPSCVAASPAASATAAVGETLAFAASCVDADGNGQGNEWYLDGVHQGNTPADAGASWVARKAFTFRAPGTYRVETTAYDAGGAYAASAVQWSVTVAARARPNLVIHDILLQPDPPRAGEEVAVTCRYGNGGDAATGSGFDVRVSIDGEARAASATALAPRAADERTVTFGPRPAGTRVVTCEVNTDRAVAESSHDDSGWSRTVTWAAASAPVLVASEVAPRTVRPGEPLTATYTLRNPRAAPVTAWLGMSLRDARGNVLDDPARDASVTLPAGATTTHTRTFLVPASAAPGAYQHLLAVWPDRFQTSPWADTGWAAGPTVAAPEQADLVVHRVALSPDPPVEGQAFTATCVFGNAGRAAASGFDVLLTLDGAGDRRTTHAGTLAPGGRDSASATFPAVVAGAHKVACEVNRNRAVAQPPGRDADDRAEQAFTARPKDAATPAAGTGYFLVHGICTTGPETWTGQDAPGGAFYRALQGRPVWAETYEPSTPERMRDGLREELLDFREENNLADVVIVGHSLGGLLARLLVADPEVKPWVRHVVTLDAPDDGQLVPVGDLFLLACADLQRRTPLRDYAWSTFTQTYLMSGETGFRWFADLGGRDSEAEAKVVRVLYVHCAPGAWASCEGGRVESNFAVPKAAARWEGAVLAFYGPQEDYGRAGLCGATRGKALTLSNPTVASVPSVYHNSGTRVHAERILPLVLGGPAALATAPGVVPCSRLWRPVAVGAPDPDVPLRVDAGRGVDLDLHCADPQGRTLVTQWEASADRRTNAWDVWGHLGHDGERFTLARPGVVHVRATCENAGAILSNRVDWTVHVQEVAPTAVAVSPRPSQVVRLAAGDARAFALQCDGPGAAWPMTARWTRADEAGGHETRASPPSSTRSFQATESFAFSTPGRVEAWCQSASGLAGPRVTWHVVPHGPGGEPTL